MEIWQGLLDAIGWLLARIFDVIPNYGISIIVLTLIIKLLLFPLGIKQIKSMQAMQAIGPRVKEIQKKYKGDKQKTQEETMRLYKEAGVNPLGGCLPLLLQFPILIAMYQVLRTPVLEPIDQPTTYRVANNHLPEDSALFNDVITHTGTFFLTMNLQCSPAQSGSQVTLTAGDKDVQTGWNLVDGDLNPLPQKAVGVLDCGDTVPSRIPYFALLALMIGSTFFQQRQMSKASPPGAANPSQQAIMKFMPLMFGIFGFTFPTGLVTYWTTSNFFQIGQQWFLLRAGHIGPDALDRRLAEQKARAENGAPAKKGFFAAMLERVENSTNERNRESQSKGQNMSAPKGSSGKKLPPGAGGTKGKKPPPKGSTTRKPKGKGSSQNKRKPRGSG